ncbi:SUKH-3 domain-containing protein [Lentzea cavernae]|uniref:SUKH-3 immunity protein n=1 Tax=Lentzea cavernae TaxID=2020703 RepID=A0ABQ3MVJ6_9PSEU|nr:SUKH-3 domain-containing protein [Lentzea cavernae]GHH63010.1 hypothetical protein GCM10017774_91620 [Lentzea cavernae]
MSPRFAPDVENRLTRAGWFPGRKVDTESWRGRLEEEGFVFPQAVLRFLEEFDGLYIEHDGPAADVGRYPVEFNPVLAVGEADRFAEWGADVGRTIAPLGEFERGQFFLGMDETGEIYHVSNWVARYGVGDAGLERLLLGHSGEELPL